MLTTQAQANHGDDGISGNDDKNDDEVIDDDYYCSICWLANACLVLPWPLPLVVFSCLGLIKKSQHDCGVLIVISYIPYKKVDGKIPKSSYHKSFRVTWCEYHIKPYRKKFLKLPKDWYVAVYGRKKFGIGIWNNLE